KYPALFEMVGFSADHFRAFDIAQSRRRLPQDSPLRELYRNCFVIVPDPQGPNGHTLFANSEVNGPCADALIQELMPAIESRYPLIHDSSARLLRGHSSGGWAALWLTTQHPQTFGPCWAYAPDPVDF